MKTALVSLVLLLAMTSVASLIVCIPEMCLNMECAEVTTENCAGRIVPHGGFCGCCDACFTILKAGENCFALILHQHIMGGPPLTVACDEGLACNPTTEKCEAVV